MMRSIFLIFFLSPFIVLAQDSCFDLSIQELSSSCEGMFDGELIAFTDAESPSYLWLNGNGDPLFPSQETQNAFNLQPGLFQLQVTDIDGCIELSDIYHLQPLDSTNILISHSQPFSIDPVSYNTWTECEIEIVNLGCDGHFKPRYEIHHALPIELGDFDVQYWKTLTSSWNTLFYEVEDGVAFGYYGDIEGEDLGAGGIQTRKIRVRFSQDNLNLGVYTAYLNVFTSDSSGNVIEEVSNIDTISVELISLCDDFIIDYLNIEQASCANLNNGSLLVNTMNGQDTVFYSLNSGAFQASNSFDSLQAGEYTLFVKDGDNCQIDTSFIIGPTSLIPDTLIFSDVTTTSLNINWLSSLLVDGYRFRYRPVDSVNWIMVGAGAWDDGIAELLSQKNIAALYYNTEYEFQVKINALSTDCVEGWSESYFVSTLPMSLNAVITNTCYESNNGEIQIEVLGGLAPYVVSWQGPNEYVNDDLYIQDLSVGEYMLLIQDASQPPITIDTSLSVTALSIIDFSISTTQPSCCGLCDASILVNFSNVSSPPFSLYINGTPVIGNVLENLCPGSFELEIIDSELCSWTELILIDDIACLDVDTVNFLSPSSAVQHPNCYGDSTGLIYVSGSGGNANYQFALNESPFQNNINNGVGNELFDMLPSGAYTVFIQDENLCQDSISVYLESAPQIVVNEVELDTAYCFNNCVNELTSNADYGGFTINATGGTIVPPNYSLQYSLDEDSILYDIQNTFSGLVPDIYAVNIKDDAGCVIEIDVQVPQSIVEYIYSVSDVSCNGMDDGSFQLTEIINGNGNETFFLEGELLQGDANNLAEGSYEILFLYEYEGASICVCEDEFYVSESEVLSVQENVEHPSCREACDGSIHIDVSGGVAPYSFNWSNDSDSNNIQNLCEGFYSVQVIDAHACVYFEQFSIVDPTIIFPIITQQGDSLIVIEPTVTNPSAGTPPYSYQWLLNGNVVYESELEFFIPSTSGEYSLIMLDSNNCEGVSIPLYFELSSLEQNQKKYVIYPNPTKQKITLTLTNLTEGVLKVFDVYGKHVLSEMFYSDLLEVDLYHLESGMYFAEITVNDKQYTSPVILNKN